MAATTRRPAVVLRTANDCYCSSVGWLAIARLPTRQETMAS
jgi:hypothetical protein